MNNMKLKILFAKNISSYDDNLPNDRRWEGEKRCKEFCKYSILEKSDNI